MNKTSASKVTFENCDFGLPSHQKAFTKLIEAYMQDPMGDVPSLSETQKLSLINDLDKHPSVVAIFVLYEEVYAGLAVAFNNYSTFRAAHYINVHDLIIDKNYRNKKLGRALLKYLIDIARKRNYCKVTLEVRNDNQVAQGLYQSLGFTECQPPMLFWQKLL